MDIADADEVIPDADGTIQQQYEEQREELQLEKPPEPILQNVVHKDTQPQQASNQQPAAGNATAQGTGGRNGNGGKNGTGGNGTGGNGNGSGGKSSKSDKKAKTIKVHFDAQGGSCDTRSLKKTVGAAYGDLPAAKRDGYTFEGWFTAADGGSAVYTTTVVASEKDHTLYAHWKKIEAGSYTLYFEPNGGRLKAREKSREIQQGQTYGTLPLPVYGGYDFDGWFTEPEAGAMISETDVFSANADQTLYAHWTYDPYKYWSWKLQQTVESMYACQMISCYLEFEQEHETASKSALLSGCLAENAAMNRGNNTTVTDEWVEGRNPKVVIRCYGSSLSAQEALDSMHTRFPGRRALAVPVAAVNGSAEEQLYFQLYLGQMLYPSWYGDIDLSTAAGELGVGGDIYE